jgi:hypothetical protein
MSGLGGDTKQPARRETLLFCPHLRERTRQHSAFIFPVCLVQTEQPEALPRCQRRRQICREASSRFSLTSPLHPCLGSTLASSRARKGLLYERQERQERSAKCHVVACEWGAQPVTAHVDSLRRLRSSRNFWLGSGAAPEGTKRHNALCCFRVSIPAQGRGAAHPRG